MGSLYDRVQKTAPNRLNPAQRATWDMIVAAYGKPELDVIPTDDGAFSFQCEMEFGVRTTGYLEVDGQVNWLG